MQYAQKLYKIIHKINLKACCLHNQKKCSMLLSRPELCNIIRLMATDISFIKSTGLDASFLNLSPEKYGTLFSSTAFCSYPSGVFFSLSLLFVKHSSHVFLGSEVILIIFNILRFYSDLPFTNLVIITS